MSKVLLTEKTEKNTDQYRKQFVRTVIAQENDVYDSVEELSEDVQALIEQYSTRTEIRDKEKIDKRLPSLFTAWGATLLATMVLRNKEAAEINGERQVYLVGSNFEYDPFTVLAKKSASDYTNWVEKRLVVRKSPLDGIPVGTRIKTIQGGALKTVQNILEVGIKSGQSAEEIARAIDNYLVQDSQAKWVSPFEYYRERWGYKVKKMPKGIPAGSASFNSIRIARSEINNTWRQATVELHKDKPWLKGYDWLLSPSHPAPDICDEWAAKSPYSAKDLPPGHPFCMCDVVPVFYRPEELGL